MCVCVCVCVCVRARARVYIYIWTCVRKRLFAVLMLLHNKISQGVASWIIIIYVRFYVFPAVTMKNVVFWYGTALFIITSFREINLTSHIGKIS
jgi:hypothetical protein